MSHVSESSTDDPYLNNGEMTETRDVGGSGSITFTHGQGDGYAKGRKNTATRAVDLISGVNDPSMRARMEHDNFRDGEKTRMSAIANQVIDAYNDQTKSLKNYRIIGAVILVLLAISISSNLGTSWYAVVSNKDTKTETATAVPDNYAVNSSSSTQSGSTSASTQSAPKVKVLTDMDGVPVRTDRSLDRMKLSSELSDDAWSNLEQLHIKGTGGAIHFDVLGWARFKGDRSRCGTVVVAYTIAGQVQFDGTAMTFSNDVAGAFVRAGFPVSAGRRARQTNDASGYTLTGIQEVFGAFSFVAQLDTSSLTCGDDVPNITNNPFTGLVNDFYLEESHLYSCNDEGRPDCPSGTDIFTILGQSYYKRVKHTRAKKLGDNWVFVARTIVPEASGAGLEAGTRANVLVEMSNGTHVLSYTEYSFEEGGAVEAFDEDSMPLQCFWNRTIEKAARALPFIDSAEESGGLLDFEMDFVGYDVVNGEYVRHYTLTARNQSALDGDNVTSAQGTVKVDMFESYEMNRLYSLGIFAPLYYSTYDVIDTNPDSGILQGANMPALPTAARDVSTWLSTAACPGDVEGTAVVAIADTAEDAALIADLFEVPDIAKYNSVFLYTDEAAEKARFARAMTVARDEAEVFASLNGTNTSDGGRHRREEHIEELEPPVAAEFKLVVHDAMASALVKHIEEGSDFHADQICGAKATCLDLFANVSAACCETKTSCLACLEHLRVDRADPTSELAVSTRAAARHRRAMPGFSFSMTCDDPWRKEGALWTGSPIKYYLDICRVAVSSYDWRYSLGLSCSPSCTRCTQPLPGLIREYCEKTTTYRYESLEGGLEVKACMACGNPYVYFEGKLWVELHRTNFAASGAGGEVKLGVKFTLVGIRFDFNLFGGLFFEFATATLKLYAGLGIGCCGFSGKVTGYLTWTPALPLPRPPTGAGVEAEGCMDWGLFKVCASLDFPIGI